MEYSVISEQMSTVFTDQIRVTKIPSSYTCFNFGVFEILFSNSMCSEDL